MEKLDEKRIIERFDEAIENNYICPYYQMQINHSTKRLVGAEALMRWIDPIYGMQMPNDFIPIFEKNGLIEKADLHVFESVCKFIKESINNNLVPIPISINLSRYDLLDSSIVNKLDDIRKKYDIPTNYLHFEITESAAVGGIELISDSINRFHKLGYIVEMDDFGSGYSSLNILKNLNFDAIKLDMRFFDKNVDDNGREGIIISSVVNMAKWLNTAIIAEGVENNKQADYLCSLGCNYIQGFLYSRPTSELEFKKLMKIINHEVSIDKSNNNLYEFYTKNFWNPNSDGTYFFNNLMPPSIFFSYHNNKIEILKVNKKYMDELGMNLNEYDLLHLDLESTYIGDSLSIYKKTIEKAIQSKKEEKCLVWRDFYSKCCGDDVICIESRIQMIGTNSEEYLFMESISNVTEQIKKYNDLELSQKILSYVGDQNDIYAWEYDISTKVMKPCHRCMRNLNLPPVIENYPEPLIATGFFPADYADFYRNMLKKLEQGVKEVEAVIPLTANRILYLIKYTLECDENNRPLKAYGSARFVSSSETKNNID